MAKYKVSPFPRTTQRWPCQFVKPTFVDVDSELKGHEKRERKKKILWRKAIEHCHVFSLPAGPIKQPVSDWRQRMHCLKSGTGRSKTFFLIFLEYTAVFLDFAILPVLFAHVETRLHRLGSIIFSNAVCLSAVRCLGNGPWSEIFQWLVSVISSADRRPMISLWVTESCVAAAKIKSERPCSRRSRM